MTSTTTAIHPINKPINKQTMSNYCYYYLSGFPGESFSSPNAFPLKTTSETTSEITLGDIKRSWPIKDGTYYFRFRQSDGQGGFSWIDVRQDDEEMRVPKFQGCVFAKVLRLDKLPRLTPTKMRLNAKKARQKQQRNTSSSSSTSSSPTPPQHQQANKPPPYRDNP
eukprot:CAMPEP_0182516320 /NCGR_PEP_ID=MMETSP1321-20130603/40042_1 /TAXON_ID=91990 /ORGANISM="Bolidomonas sp., Strain RCC1657" /LENGTH=165 /DNA_ID=CAMNT_0024723877 /DNA_START=40 /DNA_END=534 /DNA_ORIENTATION=+